MTLPRPIRVPTVVWLLACLAALLGAASARAASGAPVTYTAPTGASVTLDHSTYQPGDTVTITGKGFIGNDGNGGVHADVKPDDGAFTVASYGGADAVTPGDAGGVPTFSSEADGTFSGTVTLPSDLATTGPGICGQHWLRILAGTFGNPAPATSIQAWFSVGAPPAAPAVTVSATSVTAGDSITVEGCGFPADQPVTAALDGAPVAGTSLTADDAGNASGPVTIPADTIAGSHTLTLNSGAATASATVTVTGGGGGGGGTGPVSATLSNPTVAAGGTLQFSFAGFQQQNGTGQHVGLKLDDDAIIGCVTANADGSGSGSVTLPATLAPGQHTLRLLGGTDCVSIGAGGSLSEPPSHSYLTTFTVTGSATTPPPTATTPPPATTAPPSTTPPPRTTPKKKKPVAYATVVAGVKRLSVRSGHVALRLTGHGTRGKVRVSLTTANRLRLRKVKGKPRIVTLAKAASVTLPAGRTRTVRLVLTGQGRTLLAHTSHVRARLRLTSGTTTTRVLTLNGAARHPAKKTAKHKQTTKHKGTVKHKGTANPKHGSTGRAVTPRRTEAPR